MYSSWRRAYSISGPNLPTTGYPKDGSKSERWLAHVNHAHTQECGSRMSNSLGSPREKFELRRGYGMCSFLRPYWTVKLTFFQLCSLERWVGRWLTESQRAVQLMTLSLAQMDDLCFRIQIIRDMAFIYEPVAMDGPSTSVLFDWGSPADNQDTATYIQTTNSGNNIFHTFTLPSKKVRAHPFGCAVLLMSSSGQGRPNFVVLHRCSCMDAYTSNARMAINK